MKVGLFSPYLLTMGGGERYFLTTAEFFLRRGDQVDIFWDGERDVKAIDKRFNLNLEGVHFLDDIFFAKTNLFSKLLATTKYDLLYFLSDGSIPTSFAKRNIIHFQVPFDDKDHQNFLNWLKLRLYKAIICNSQFTKKYIDRSFGVKSLVIYPPVAVDDFAPGKKENLILSVGRFVNQLHPKKHEIMIREFAKLTKKLPSWRLVLVGGTSGEDDLVVDRMKKKSRGYPIEIVANCGFAKLRDYYGQAKIYWHAAGYGEDLKKFPEKAEHFGMTTVEAMSAGAVPIVFAGGGQKEIITNGKNGFFWQTPKELIDTTVRLAKDDPLQLKIAVAARLRSKDFSKEKFFAKLNEIL